SGRAQRYNPRPPPHMPRTTPDTPLRSGHNGRGMRTWTEDHHVFADVHDATSTDDEPSTPDLWLALAAGHKVWAEGSEPPGPRERVAATAAFVGAVGGLGVAWIGMRLETRHWPWNARTDHDVRLTLAGLLVMLASGVLAIWYLRTAFGRPTEPKRFW